MQPKSEAELIDAIRVEQKRSSRYIGPRPVLCKIATVFLFILGEISRVPVVGVPAAAPHHVAALCGPESHHNNPTILQHCGMSYPHIQRIGASVSSPRGCDRNGTVDRGVAKLATFVGSRRFTLIRKFGVVGNTRIRYCTCCESWLRWDRLGDGSSGMVVSASGRDGLEAKLAQFARSRVTSSSLWTMG